MSTAPPVVSSHPLVKPEYDLKDLPTVAGAKPERVSLDAFKLGAAKLIAEAWEIDVAKVYASVDVAKKGVDLSVAIPRFFKKDQADWGKKVVDAFKPSALFTDVKLTGVFLSFTINKKSFTYHTLRTINQASRAARENPSSHTEAYGTDSSEGSGKHMLIDFSSPNIAKPFHAGHLRSTIIGAVVANLFEAMGWKVTRLNYLGDWGTQYGLLSVGFDRFGNEEKLLANPINHLFEVYVAANEVKEKEKAQIDAGEITDLTTTIHGQAQKVFKAMENGDAKALAQWSRFRELSIEKLKEVYEKLNIHFDVFWGESQVSTDSMDRALRVVQEKNLTCEDRGALLVDLTKFKMDRAIVRKADGTTIYLTRDLGGAYDKYEKYKFDKHIYVVQSAQTLHFNQLFKSLELMEEEFAKPGMLEHINFGRVHGMSTRKGTVKFLDDIIDEAVEVMHDQMRSNEAKYAQVEDPETTSAVIGASAVKIQDMSAKRINDYNFDIRRCTSFEGDFGPFIQYSYVRLCSVERKNPNVVVPTSIDEVDMTVLDEPKVHDIIMHLALYPNAVTIAYTNREPSTIVTWCFKLSHLIGSAWETVKVANASEEEAKARLFLYVQIREVLAHAMGLLSLSLIERM